jgi:AcrR family transcriptional regulator
VIARLLAVVERLLEEQDSYLELAVEQILERDGMARSTFYSYFDDKADLVMALGERAMQEIIKAAQAIWQLPPDATREQVAAAVRHTIETYLPHTRLMNAVLEVSTYDARVRARFNAGYAEAQRAAAQHIRSGQRAGFIRPDLRPDETAGWFTWMAERGMTQLVQHAGRAKLSRLEDTFTSILWYTLYDGQGRTDGSPHRRRGE